MKLATNPSSVGRCDRTRNLVQKCYWCAVIWLVLGTCWVGSLIDRQVLAQDEPESSVVQESESNWLYSQAFRIPSEYTSEESGYFSIVEAGDGKIYIGTAKYGDNAYLIEFDPTTKTMRMVLDAEQAIGEDRSGFAAQAKFHTRNHVGESGKIYLGTKQGYAREGEQFEDYPGGYPMVFDPATTQTKVYPIPVPHHGIISVVPDERRGVAYVSTCSDERPIESTHFMVLDLATGTYRDLLDCRHMYAFVVVDYLGRAYHPVLGGKIARFNPDADQLELLEQQVDGQAVTEASLLASPESHPINWELSPDRKTLYAIAMSANQLIAYDLTESGPTLMGRSLGPLIKDAIKTDCRAMAVGDDGTVWAGVAATSADGETRLRLVSWRPLDRAGQRNVSPPVDHGAIAIGQIDRLDLEDEQGKTKPWHHGIERMADGTLVPRFVIMGICPAKSGTVYVTTLYPFTLHALTVERP